MLYVFSKLAGAVLSPANLFTLLLLLGAFAGVSHDERCQAFGRRLCFILAILLFMAAVFPVGRWALLPLENRFNFDEPKKVDGIVLLAGDENPHLTSARHQASVHDSARRYITWAGLARAYPKAKLAFIGGTGSVAEPSSLTSADVARSIIASLGIPLERVTFEDQSRTTYENATVGAAMIKPSKEQNWLLVTSASHMPRALLSFRKAGWHVYPAPTDYRTARKDKSIAGFSLLRNMRDLDVAMHEYAGLLFYWLMDRIDNPW
jgi:uncharacterized SAM-binding protein YcdF (DUF218 family)